MLDRTSDYPFALRRPSRRIKTFASSGGRSILVNLSADEICVILEASTLAAITPKTITDPELIWKKV